MTERLTEINEFGNADIIGVYTFKLFENLKPTEFLQASNAIDKLAHYEDLEEQGHRIVNINKIIEQLEENYSCDVGNLKMISVDKVIEVVKGSME